VSYVPNDKTVFEAAYSGILSGFAASGRWLQDESSGDYSNFAIISGAFTQEFDTRWAIDPDTIPPNTLQVFLIEKCCKSVWENRFTQVTTETLTPSEYAEIVESIIALIKAGDSYFAAQGITPDPWPTSGGGTVTAVDAGTAITVTGTASVPIVNNAGVTSNIAGTGIGVSSATGPVTITNEGVTSLVAGTGISVSGATGAVTVSNTGVESVTAGTNVTVTGTATNPIINATGGGETPVVVTIQTPGDSNPHTLTTRPVTTNTELVVECVWLARDPTDGNDEGGRSAATFKNVAGTASIEGTTSKIWQQANAGGVSLTFAVTGADYTIVGVGNGDGVTDWTLYIYEYPSQL
jgi:hypothetical protein